MIIERMVLLGIQNLQQCRGGITAVIHPDLVDFVEQKQWIANPGLGQLLEDFSRQGAYVGASMPANLRLVTHPAQGHAHEAAVGRTGNALTERGLSNAWRPDKTQHWPLGLADALLHCKIFENPFLDLFQAIVILFQDL